MIDMIRVQNVSKKIKRNCVLDQIHLELPRGKCYGFVGPNGSGKTMLFRTIIGFVKPTQGQVFNPFKDMGIIIENPGFLPGETGFENLKFLSLIRKKIGDTEIKQAMLKVGLDPEDPRKVREYSLGMRQKLAIAQAIMEQPQLLILDEPTRGIDRDSLVQIRQLLLEYKRNGVTMLIASHDEKDIELLCDVIYYMQDGKIVDQIAKEAMS